MTGPGGIFSSERLRAAIPVVIILALVVGLYSNTFEGELTYWDDNRYVTDNHRIKDLSLEKALKIFDPKDLMEDPQVELKEYLPLTTLVHAVAYSVSGLEPWGYHLANLLFYLAVVALVYVAAHRLLADRLSACLAALVFAVMPVHVESVTWIAATKDTVSGVFFLASFILYIRYSEGTERRRLFYALSLGAFVLAMLSKTLVVTLPILLALHDVAFHRRLRVLDKVPYVIVGVLLSVLYMKVNVEYSGGEYITTDLGLWRLLLTNLTVLRDYMGMVFAPLGMNAYYTYWPDELPTALLEPGVLFSALLVLAVAAAGFIAWLRGSRVIPFAVFWFFIAFLPVLNLVPSSTLKADRYLFIPSIGFAVLAGWGAVRLRGLSPRLRRAVPVVFVAWVVFLSALTFERNGDWQSGVTLWRDSLEKKARADRPHFILGNELRHRGRLGEAMAEYEAALSVNPGHKNACNNLGAAYGSTGRILDAARTFERCMNIDPGDRTTRLNLAKSYIALGRTDLATELLQGLLREDPGDDNARALLEMASGI